MHSEDKKNEALKEQWENLLRICHLTPQISSCERWVLAA